MRKLLRYLAVMMGKREQDESASKEITPADRVRALRAKREQDEPSPKEIAPADRVPAAHVKLEQDESGPEETSPPDRVSAAHHEPQDLDPPFVGNDTQGTPIWLKRYFGLSYQAWIGLSLIAAIVWYAISATKSGEGSYEELYVALIIAVVGAVLVFRDWLKPRRLSRVWRVLSISGVALVCSVVMLLVLGAARMEWGSCVSGDCESGYGTFNYFSGDIYEGEFRNGQRTLGTFRQINGKTYVGEWRDGIPDGQGTTTFSNGDVYVGEHLGFSPWGTGTKTYADGRVESGQWKFGRLVEPE